MSKVSGVATVTSSALVKVSVTGVVKVVGVGAGTLASCVSLASTRPLALVSR